MKIFKYPIPMSSGEFSLTLPRYSHFLKIGIQKNLPYMWFMVDESNPLVEFFYKVIFTGQEFYAQGAEHLDTVQIADLVIHVFQVYK